MPSNDTTILVSRFIPGSERCANFLVVGTGISERVRVTGSRRHRARCRLLVVAGNGRRGDWRRIQDDTVLGKEPPRSIGRTRLIGESKKDALKATRQLFRSGRTLPAADCFVGFPGTLKRPGRAITTHVPVRLLPTT